MNDILAVLWLIAVLLAALLIMGLRTAYVITRGLEEVRNEVRAVQNTLRK